MRAKFLQGALSKVDWTTNINAFFSDSAGLDVRVEKAARSVALWIRQFHELDKDNPAISFVHEMQLSTQNVAVLISLGLYKPAAASMRGVLEAGLHYSYFRSHHVELSSLARRTGYFVDKEHILEFHKIHTAGYNERQNSLGLLGDLRRQYADLSAIVHGQVPGEWATYLNIDEIKYSPDAAKTSVECFEKLCILITKFFLCTIAPDFWHGFSTEAKREFLRGLSGEQKSVLGLDQS